MKKIFNILFLIAVLLVGTVFIINYSYPVKYKKEVEKYSKAYGVDKNLVYAVIKCESGFEEEAVSAKGAVGLMQLMPETARFMAEKIGLTTYQLNNHEDNINLGVAYLSYLIKKFGEEVAIYAYNAGEGRVSRFLEGGGEIKLFPYEETARYYKRVKGARAWYNRLDFIIFR